MINKKIFTVASVVAVLSASASFAQTEGSYVGLDALQNRSTLATGDNNKSTYGAGLSYKYAFPITEGVFLAPGVFVEKNDVKIASKNDDFNAHNRYGVKADLGYDLDKRTSVYLTGGLSFLKYSLSTNVNGKGHIDSSSDKANLFGGIGLTHQVSEKVSLNVEYDTQSVDLRTHNTGLGKQKLDLNTIKVGVSYHF